jgi:hypothetical protein
MGGEVNPVCNACGERNTPSEEHLIHLALGRVVLANPEHTTETFRAEMRTGRWRGFRCVAPSKLPRFAALADTRISNLLCGECNMGWARELEQRAGAHLGDVLNRDSPVNARLLRRWLWFFSTKAWWLTDERRCCRTAVCFRVCGSSQMRHAVC